MYRPLTYWFFGTQLTIITDEEQTPAGYDLIEVRFPPGTETPLHLHTAYDELIYVLEGEFKVYLESGEIVLVVGQQMLVPRNASHVVSAPGKTVNRALVIVSPSGLAQLIRTVGIPFTEGSMPPVPSNDMGLFLQLSYKLGDMILGSHGARPMLREPK